jgi:hypothetical protein
MVGKPIMRREMPNVRAIRWLRPVVRPARGCTGSPNTALAVLETRGRRYIPR